MPTDNLSSLNVFLRRKVITGKTNKRPENVRSAYHDKKSYEIAFVRSLINIAAALTETKNRDFLIKTFSWNKLEHPFLQRAFWYITLSFKVEGKVNVSELCNFKAIAIDWASLRLSNMIRCAFYLRLLQSQCTLWAEMLVSIDEQYLVQRFELDIYLHHSTVR